MSNCKLFNQYKEQIKHCCEENSLDFGIVENAVKSWNSGNIFILHHDPEKGKEGLRDETPMPVTLRIYVENENVRIEQTEHTQTYLQRRFVAYES